MSSSESQESQDVDMEMHQAARLFQQLLPISIFFRKRLMLSLNRRNPSIVQVRLSASRRDFSFPFRRFPDFPSKARARVKRKKRKEGRKKE